MTQSRFPDEMGGGYTKLRAARLGLPPGMKPVEENPRQIKRRNTGNHKAYRRDGLPDKRKPKGKRGKR